MLHGSGSRSGIALLAVVLLLGGCASIKVSNRDEYQGEKLARPDRIYVHDFAATLEDLPAWSEVARSSLAQNSTASPEEVEAGRELGVAMTNALVARIAKMGLSAERASDQSVPHPGDIVIVGYLTSIDEGSGFKRVVVGFGSGAAEITSQDTS
jgi:hypothetical protein